tara:strand:+ start:3766 stop:4479 length:714 start_codon:yes stop_codon:yes gene_type:complete
MKDSRKQIEYYNRKYVCHFTSERVDADFDFFLNPPNEFAFNNNYNQCLIKIRKAIVSNRGDGVNFGLDAQWTDIAGAGQVVVPAGVLLFTNLKSQNSLHFASVASNPIETGIQCVLHNTGGSPSLGGNFQGIANNCASGVVRGQAAGGAGLQGDNANIHSVVAWEYHDDRSIEEAGVLCSNPFGQQFQVRLRDPVNGDICKLTSEGNFNVAASNGSSLNLELEVLMLANPTPGEGGC